MIQFPTVFQGFIIMLASEFAAINLVFFGGQILDWWYSKCLSMGFFTDYPGWQTVGLTNTYINMYYGMCLMIAIFGIVMFVGALFFRQRYDSHNVHYEY